MTGIQQFTANLLGYIPTKYNEIGRQLT